MKQLTTPSMWCPGARLGVLTSKAGMSFSFMGIMLASARSIKDSDCGLTAGRPGVLTAALLLDAPRSRTRKKATQIFRFSPDPVPIIPRPRRDGEAESSSGHRHPVETGIGTSSGLRQPDCLGSTCDLDRQSIDSAACVVFKTKAGMSRKTKG
jgi:hypothetical protein